MNFIAVKDNELVNADKVVSIRIQTIKGKKTLVLFTESRSYTVDADKMDVLESLVATGANLTNQFTSV